MLIERIVKKDDETAAIYFDNDEKLIISTNILYQSGLRKGDEISEDRFSFFIKQNQLYFIKQRAFRYLGRRLHSERELYFKLKNKNYEDELIKEVISQLKLNRYLDDEEFCKLYVEDKLNIGKWGKNKIKSGLIEKGVRMEIIDRVFDEMIENESEIELAEKLAEKKLISIKRKEQDKRVQKQKLFSYLVTKGFDFDTIRSACDKVLK